MKNLPHEIILLLYSHSSDVETNTVLNKLINNSNIGRTEEVKAQKLRNILESLGAKDYLEWQVAKDGPGLEGFYTPMESYKTNFAKGNETLLNNHISAHLTPTGLDYAIDIDRQRIQHRNNNIAMWFSGATVLITGFTLIMETTSHKRIETKQQQSQDSLQSLNKRLQTAEDELNYLIQARRNDSIKNALLNAKP